MNVKTISKKRGKIDKKPASSSTFIMIIALLSTETALTLDVRIKRIPSTISTDKQKVSSYISY